MTGVRHNFHNFSTDIRTEVVEVVSDPATSRYIAGVVIAQSASNWV